MGIKNYNYARICCTAVHFRASKQSQTQTVDGSMDTYLLFLLPSTEDMGTSALASATNQIHPGWKA